MILITVITKNINQSNQKTPSRLVTKEKLFSCN